ncbi:Aminomethyltransferase folate-binding domain-containing protein [Meira miltonrushii]|uniref:Aminomethyltransferase folate-binding domain-containing protein n=1 Tax=Meira miltonrushii TaxID=1280837 RepID=A0A316V7S3_9BASI|nr:Aminomethyltransferase folate-binding domain-containing protein [Meira miltonrushii]PWN32521.1 Aminomethyltransferase folate-binding domain-containing protein [Meira miltonrushii]
MTSVSIRGANILNVLRGNGAAQVYRQQSRKLHAVLSNRSVVRASGKDSEKLIQNLTTNDVKKVSDGQGQLTAFLKPEGRTIAFAFLYRVGEDLFFDVDKNALPDVLAAIKKFKLRSKITLTDVSQEMDVVAHWAGDEPIQNTLISIADQRAPEMGFRSIIRKEDIGNTALSDLKAYTVHRTMQGIAETSQEITIGGMPLEENLDLMHGVDFRKGCYIGQELTARTHHTGVIRKRIVPVSLADHIESEVSQIQHRADSRFELDQQLDNGGIDVRSEPLNKDPESASGRPSRGRSAGKLLSVVDNVGLAMLRLEQVNRWNKDLTMQITGKDKPIHVRPWIPTWWPENVQQQQ